MTNQKSKSLACLTLALSVLVVPLSLSAQDPFGDPFGGGTTATPPPASGGVAPADKAKPVEDDDPLIKSIVDGNPTSPVDLVRSIEILLDYGRADLAKTYADQLSAMTLTPAQLVDLHTRFRSALFLRIAREQLLQPAGGSIEKRVMDAANQAARGRVTALISQLSGPAAAQRYTALVDLREARDIAITAMLQVLGDATRDAEHQVVRDGLVAVLTPPADVRYRNSSLPLTEIVVAAVATSDPALQVQVLGILGRLSARAATPFLLRPALAVDSTPEVKSAARQALLEIVGALPTQQDAETYLERRVRAFLADQRAGANKTQTKVTVWEWDDARRTAIQRTIDPEHTALLKARRLSRELYLLSPDRQLFRNLYLATALQAEKTLGGLSTPLDKKAGSAFADTAARGVAAVMDVFEFALNNDQVAGAMGAVEVLGEIGDASLLWTTDGRPGLLTRMLLHENRRMRFTATRAVLQLDPRGPYPGSSYLVDALAYFARTGGARRILVAHPRTDAGQMIVGMFRELGFEADTAQTGNQAIKFAHDSPDYQFILISDAIDRPAVAELLQKLRRDPRTRNLPLGVMTRQQSARRMSHLTQTDPLAISFPRLHATEAVRIQTRRLLDLAGRSRLGADERMVHAEFALQQIARLVGEPQTYAFYDLARYESSIRGALNNSPFTDSAARALGLLATPDAQRTLIDFANQTARPLLDRQSAAEAFAAAVRLRGILLTRGEILAQYDRYNESANADVETQKLLGSILDAIEAPSQSKPDADAGVATEE
jgi:CheY-like chemotaxis protein